MDKETSGRVINTTFEIISDREQEIKKLRKALEFYADENNYYRSYEDIVTGYPPEVMNDRGWTARKALEK